MAKAHEYATPGGVLQVRLADGFISRALGLLVGEPLGEAEGLLISPCSGIHTFGMPYAIDVVFVDRQARVVRVCKEVRAGRIRFVPGARAVLELRAGVAARLGLTPGVQIPELAGAL
jgi:uncharacterized membrane protein (UPF0127 family)